MPTLEAIRTSADDVTPAGLSMATRSSLAIADLDATEMFVQ